MNRAARGYAGRCNGCFGLRGESLERIEEIAAVVRRSMAGERGQFCRASAVALATALDRAVPHHHLELEIGLQAQRFLGSMRGVPGVQPLVHQREERPEFAPSTVRKRGDQFFGEVMLVSVHQAKRLFHSWPSHPLAN